MKINKPAWFKPYTEFDAAWSADNSLFWGMIGSGPQGFKYYVFRQIGDGESVQVPYDPMGVHGKFTVLPIGLFVNVFDDNERHVIPVQGYIPHTAEKLPVDPIVIQNRLAGEDAFARTEISTLKNTLAVLTKTANDAYSIVTKHIGSIHLNEASVYTIADIVVKSFFNSQEFKDWDWSQAGNRQYGDLLDAVAGKNPDLAAAIKKLAGDSHVDEDALTKAIMRKLGELLIAASN